MLYPHALESIFAFASLKDLSALMSVSRSWQAAVLSMSPCCLQTRTPPRKEVDSLLASRLRRHVSALVCVSHVRPALPFAERMPQLHSLDVAFRITRDSVNDPFTFPPRLRCLTISLHFDQEGAASAATLASPLVAIAQQLPLLTKLHIEGVGSFSLLPLQSMPQLRTLDALRMAVPADKTVEDLRGMSQLEVLRPPGRLLLRRLLAPGHSLRLKDIGSFNDEPQSQEDYDTLATLPTLTTLHLNLPDLQQMDFVLALPQLRQLSLSLDQHIQMDRPRVTAALRSCTQLTTLNLSECGFTVDQLADCLGAMPLLHSLKISEFANLASLSFLRSGTLPQTLKWLRLGNLSPRLPLAELRHLHPLQSLHSLEILRVCVGQPDAPQFAPFRVPSALLPSLRYFFNGPSVGLRQREAFPSARQNGFG